MFLGLSEGLLLIAICLGYFVLIKAEKALGKNTKFLGYVIGVTIIVCGALLLVRNLLFNMEWNLKKLQRISNNQVCVPPFPDKMQQGK